MQSAQKPAKPSGTFVAHTRLRHRGKKRNKLEEIVINTNPDAHRRKDSNVISDGLLLHRLYAEMESICKALLVQIALELEAPTTELISKGEETRAANWRLELLEARLHKVDDAINRLMLGSYGSCTKCGKGIEDSKHDWDPTIAFCLSCWARMETSH